MTREAALHELLISLFSAEELRAHLSLERAGDLITRSLPEVGATPARLFVEAVDVLERQGIVDRVFFDNLEAARPLRIDEIRKVRDHWLAGPLELTPPPTPSAADPGLYPRLRALLPRLRAHGPRAALVAAAALTPYLAWRACSGDADLADDADAPVAPASPEARADPARPAAVADAGPAAPAGDFAAVRLAGLPGGTFVMGSTPAEQQRFAAIDGGERPDADAERPLRVELSPFEIGVTEVTNAQWKAVMGASPSDCATGCSDDQPVHGVSWDDALEFLNKLTDRENAARGEQRTRCYRYSERIQAIEWVPGCTGYRLPTEAEWEYAARAGTTTAYSFGDDPADLCEHANGADLSVGQIDPEHAIKSTCDDGAPLFAAVARYRPNPWGLFDMHGNVREWVWDRYYVPPRDLAPPALTRDPRGAPQGLSRVLRGGSVLDPPGWLRSASRQADDTNDTRGDNGLRCARGVPADPPREPVRADCSQAGGCVVRWNGAKIRTIGGGANHLCLVPSDGSLVCWGSNNDGQLGYGDQRPRFLATGDPLFYTLVDSPTGTSFPRGLPIARVAVDGVVGQVEGGESHTCVKFAASGRLRCWGRNDRGQLGYGHTDDLGDEPDDMPRTHVPTVASVEQLAVGGDHTCAVVDGGAVRCWGGPGRGEDSQLPRELPGVSAVVQLAAGLDHDCALLRDKTVQCWGNGRAGQLGHGSTAGFDPRGQLAPSAITLGSVLQLAAGSEFTCARLEGGEVRCWGLNSYGQLGLGHTDTIGNQPGEMPPAAVDFRGRAIQVVTGRAHACVLLDSKKVRCWGDGSVGQLGVGVREPLGDQPDEMPPADVPLGGDVDHLFAHLGSYTCALLIDGTLRCWGNI
jgi:formylglycine-generating enzyme required for sulfatase activity/alpha-tubulin suppressor-like RCC1 family protein